MLCVGHSDEVSTSSAYLTNCIDFFTSDIKKKLKKSTGNFPGEAVNGYAEEIKQIRRIKYFIVYLYILYTYLWWGVKLLGVG